MKLDPSFRRTLAVLSLTLGFLGCTHDMEASDPAEGDVQEVSQPLPWEYEEDESCPYVYQMYPAPAGVSGKPGTFAAKWKAALKNVAANPDYSTCTVWGSDTYTNASCLNQQEASSVIFPNGDPPGTWSDNYSFIPGGGSDVDAEQVVIGAAMVMHQWKSPTFVTIIHQFPTMSAPGFAVVAIRKIKVNISSCQPLTSLCQGFTNTSLAADAVDASCVAAHGAEIELESVDVDYWGPEPDAGQSGTASLTGAQFISAVNASGLSYKYTVDPPSVEEGELMSARIQTLARAVQGRFFIRNQVGQRIRSRPER